MGRRVLARLIGSGRALVVLGILFGLAVTPAHAQHPRKTDGRWSQVRNWGIPGTHLALLQGPDTSSLVLALPSEGHGGAAARNYYVWRWRSDTAVFHTPSHPLDTVRVTPPIEIKNMFCSGHSALADGRLLVVGGSEGAPLGSWHANIFDPRAVPMDSTAWTPVPPMSVSRYYPSNVTLPDGRVMVFSGSTYGHVLSFGGSDLSSFRDDLQLNAGLDSVLVHDPGSLELAEAPPARGFQGAIFRLGPELDGSETPGYPYLGRALVFGGLGDDDHALNDVWEIKRNERQNRWSSAELTPNADPSNGLPAPRQQHAVAQEIIDANYSEGSRMFAYGGLDTSGQGLSDCWQLSGLDPGGTLAWKRVISGLWPRRYGHTIAAITYDDVTRVIVVGGRVGSAISDTVWALNIPEGGTPSWNVMRIGGPKRHGHVMVAIPGTLLLFGGTGPGGTLGLHNDVWAFTLADSTWTQLTVPNGPDGAPSPRHLHAGAYDPQFQRLVIVGGATNAGGSTAAGDVWSLPISSPMSPGPWHRDFASLPAGARLGHSVFVDPRIKGIARIPEVYSPAANAWQTLPSLERYQPFYPFMFLLPNGKLFDAGPDSLTQLMRLSTLAWESDTIEADEQAGSAVLYRPWKVMKCGRTSGYHFPGIIESEMIDLSTTGPTWSEAGSIGLPRTEHNLTVLPTGDVLMTGGVERQEDDAVRRPEAKIWNDVAGWSGALAAEAQKRDYHSAALLLPDGRVLSAGGFASPQLLDADLYEPPYLFDDDGNYAKRPPISSAPQEIFYGQSFQIETDTASVISNVTLIRPGAVTHGFNQDQRFLDLAFTTYPPSYPPSQLQAWAPVDSFHAPPGNYLLFLVNDRGVPAIAKWVRLKRQPDQTGGCPTVDVLTAGGWAEENTILTRSVDAAVGVDGYRLKSAPLREQGRYTIRIRENGGDYTTLDEVGLGIVDHARNVRALPMGDRVVMGTREPAFRVTTHTGQDITHLVDGSGTESFVGEPGETLLVVMSPPPQAVIDLDPWRSTPAARVKAAATR